MVTDIGNAEHYTWGAGCDGWHLLKSPTLSVIQERMPPDAIEQTHRHDKAQQVFFILSGIATFEVNGERREVFPLQSIYVPARTRHRILNNDLEDLHFLVISEPASHEDREDLL